MIAPAGRTLYRYVDWNYSHYGHGDIFHRRTLYRYVDWNYDDYIEAKKKLVVPYIGTWIETYVPLA